MGRLARRDLKQAIALFRKELKDRYPRNHRKVKYGPSVNRGFTAEEHERFLKHVENRKARFAFKTMRALGLRIGEVVGIQVQHIDWLSRTIHIQTEKSSTGDIMPLHDGIFEDLREWVNEHHRAIMNHDGHIFWSDNPVQKRQHISKDWLRKAFAQARDAAGLTQTYALTQERTGRTPRRQYRLTTHSNRHGFGRQIWLATKDLKAVQISLRQTSMRSAEPYIYVAPEEVHDQIRKAYAQPPPAEELKIDIG